MCRDWENPSKNSRRLLAFYFLLIFSFATSLLETFRFGNENGYECEIWLKVFSRILKKTPEQDTPESFIVLVDSPEKLALFSILKEVKPCFHHKMIKLPTFDNVFRHYDILAKTRSGMTTALAFFRQNGGGSIHARALLSTGKISYSLLMFSA